MNRPSPESRLPGRPHVRRMRPRRTESSMPRTIASRRLAATAVALGALLALGGPLRAQPIDPKVKADLIEKIRVWFDQKEDSWKGRKGLAAAVKAVKDGGTDLLKETDEL